MISTNAAWDARNAALAKAPIYVFAIGGEARVYTTRDLAAAGVTGELPENKPWLKTPRGASQSIDVINGQASIGEMELELVDQAGAVRQLVGATSLEGRSAALSVGYPGIAYSEFVTLYTYVVTKITPVKGYTGWKFQTRDRQISMKQTIRANPINGGALTEDNPWIVLGTPAEIVQAVYLFALWKDPANLDLAGMRLLDSAAEGLYKAARPFRFEISEPCEAKQFLESEIYKVAGLYPVVLNTGQISLRGPRAPAAGPAPAFTFDQDNMTLLPTIDRMPIVNEIIFQFDHDGDDFQTKLVYIDATSVSAFGRARQLSIESKGLRTELGAEWFCQNAARRLFRRFAGTPEGLKGGAPVIDIEAFLLTLPVWVGDYVAVTHPLMPDVTSGALGVTNRLFEVIDRTPAFANGKMRFRLLDTGLTGKAAAYGWAPCARPFVIGESEVY